LSNHSGGIAKKVKLEDAECSVSQFQQTFPSVIDTEIVGFEGIPVTMIICWREFSHTEQIVDAPLIGAKLLGISFNNDTGGQLVTAMAWFTTSNKNDNNNKVTKHDRSISYALFLII
jgi:hypothetical protein